jgi:hypothetical protein
VGQWEWFSLPSALARHAVSAPQPVAPPLFALLDRAALARAHVRPSRDVWAIRRWWRAQPPLLCYPLLVLKGVAERKKLKALGEVLPVNQGFRV